MNAILQRLTDKTAEYNAVNTVLLDASAKQLDAIVRRSLRRERRFQSKEAQRLVSQAQSALIPTSDIRAAVSSGATEGADLASRRLAV